MQFLTMGRDKKIPYSFLLYYFLCTKKHFKFRSLYISMEYINLFYRHAPKISWLLLRDPELRSKTTYLLRQLLPQVRSLVDRKEAIFTHEIKQEIESLLNQFKAEASPELEEVLDQLIWELNNDQLLDLERIGISLAAN